MINISIIGTGNVAWHLARTIAATPALKLSQVCGRRAESLSDFSDFGSVILSISQLKPVELILIAVSDDAIATVAQQISQHLGIVAHTSGSVEMQVLDNHKNYGVFYPLQTFSKGRALDFSPIPICLEASSLKNKLLLEQVAFALSENIYTLNSSQRAQVHLSAVFANNFTNHILTEAKKITDAASIDFKILKPLLEETVNKAFINSNLDNQTGPAKRGDYKTINQQIDALNNPELRSLYQTLTNSILSKYGKEKL